MPRQDEGILSTIGRTPLVRLTKIYSGSPFTLYAKLESFNPGGSMKDRAAYSMLKQAMDTGAINSGTIIVESSSGNMGIGLAQACAYLGLQFICVVDPKVTTQNIRMLEAYGAEIDIVLEPHVDTKEYLQARLDRVQELLSSIEHSFWPNQYANLYNAAGHHQTMKEIVDALGFAPDYLFCATSTCGTLRGCAEYIAEQKLATQIIAVDAIGSVIFGGEKKLRLIPGHGAAVRPALFNKGLAVDYIKVSDLECVLGCRRLVGQEAILAGGSAGAVVSAFGQMREQIEEDATCVMILADRGERYLDTIYSDEWVLKNFGEVAHLWQNMTGEETCVTATL
ncbi:MAG TPA: 2,3-diaminopropionate biosynthesis protein SbnA [Pyrinomonadaceae bacterium]